MERYYNLPIRQDDDLIIDTIYSASNSVKVITTVFKNYFSNTSAQYLVKYECNVSESYSKWDYELSPSLDINDFYRKNAEFGFYQIGSIGNDSYNLHPLVTYDKNGNDKYENNITGTGRYVVDLAGNDIHKSLQSGSLSKIDGYKGND